MEITPAIKADFLKFDSKITLSEMIGSLKSSKERFGLVFKNNKYFGLVERKRLLRTNIDVKKTKLEDFVQKKVQLNEHADIIESAYLMFNGDVCLAPIMRGKNIIGVLDALDLIELALQLPEINGLKVDDFRLVKSVQLNKDDSVANAFNLMYQLKIEQIPIFENNQIYGIISYDDLLKKYMNWSPKRESSKRMGMVLQTRSANANPPKMTALPISSFSTNDNLITAAGSTLLTEAVGAMKKNNLHSLLIMNGVVYEGILTIRDILRRIGSLEIPQNFNIKFIGLKEAQLSADQTFNFKKIASNEAFKLQREINNDFKLVLHLKEYGKTGDDKKGKRHKYSVNLRLDFASKIFTAEENDWYLETAVKKVFSNLISNLQKKIRN